LHTTRTKNTQDTVSVDDQECSIPILCVAKVPLFASAGTQAGLSRGTRACSPLVLLGGEELQSYGTAAWKNKSVVLMRPDGSWTVSGRVTLSCKCDFRGCRNFSRRHTWICSVERAGLVLLFQKRRASPSYGGNIIISTLCLATVQAFGVARRARDKRHPLSGAG
jgi:hypothetical protein